LPQTTINKAINDIRKRLNVRVLHDSALHNIYRSVVLAKLLYASSSWIGFSNATDRQKLQAFFNRSKQSGFCDSETDDFATLCSTADKQLFNRILNQPEHVLHPLLPPPIVPPSTIFVTDHTTGYFVNVLPD